MNVFIFSATELAWARKELTTISTSLERQRAKLDARIADKDSYYPHQTEIAGTIDILRMLLDKIAEFDKLLAFKNDAEVNFGRAKGMFSDNNPMDILAGLVARIKSVGEDRFVNVPVAALKKLEAKSRNLARNGETGMDNFIQILLREPKRFGATVRVKYPDGRVEDSFDLRLALEQSKPTKSPSSLHDSAVR